MEPVKGSAEMLAEDLPRVELLNDGRIKDLLRANLLKLRFIVEILEAVPSDDLLRELVDAWAGSSKQAVTAEELDKSQRELDALVEAARSKVQKPKEARNKYTLSDIIARYGKPEKEDPTERDYPKPLADRRSIVYQPEAVRIAFAPIEEIGAEPPFKIWEAFNFIDEHSQESLSADEALSRLSGRVKLDQSESLEPNDSNSLRDEIKGRTTQHADPPRLEDEGQSGG